MKTLIVFLMLTGVGWGQSHVSCEVADPCSLVINGPLTPMEEKWEAGPLEWTVTYTPDYSGYVGKLSIMRAPSCPEYGVCRLDGSECHEGDGLVVGKNKGVACEPREVSR